MSNAISTKKMTVNLAIRRPELGRGGDLMRCGGGALQPSGFGNSGLFLLEIACSLETWDPVVFLNRPVFFSLLESQMPLTI